jgi:hypothetical protein
MLAEIFMLRLDAERRLLAREVLPSSISAFIPLKPKSNHVFKETDPKDAEASGLKGFQRRPADRGSLTEGTWLALSRRR